MTEFSFLVLKNKLVSITVHSIIKVNIGKRVFIIETKFELMKIIPSVNFAFERTELQTNNCLVLIFIIIFSPQTSLLFIKSLAMFIVHR